MSLDFNYSKIANKDVVTTHPEDLGKDPTKERVRYHPVFDSVVWSLMIIGIGRIDEKTLPEVQKRFGQYQKACGPLLAYNDGTEAYITDADLALLVGLSTNVSNMTDAQWNKHLMEILDREAQGNRKPTRAIGAFDMCAYMALVREDGTRYIP